MTRAPLILAAAAMLACLLVGLVVRESRARAAGVEVLTPMQAVDPRSLLSGHYVEVDLAHPAAGLCPPGPSDEAPQGWVALAPRGGVHVLAGVAATREAASALGPVTVRGAARCENDLGAGGTVRLELAGVARFHASQAEAEAIEAGLRARPASPVLAILSAGRDGKARLKGLVVDGRRIELRWL